MLASLALMTVAKSIRNESYSQSCTFLRQTLA